MMKSIKTICLVGATAFLTACGWHFDNGAAVPAELKTMALESSDHTVKCQWQCVSNCLATT